MTRNQKARKQWFLNRAGKYIYAIRPKKSSSYLWVDYYENGVFVETPEKAIELFEIEQQMSEKYVYLFRFVDRKEDRDMFHVPRINELFK